MRMQFVRLPPRRHANREYPPTPPRSEASGSGLPLPKGVDLPQPDLPGSELSFALLPARQRLLIGRSSRKRQQLASLPEVVDEANDSATATIKGVQPAEVKPRSSRKGEEASNFVEEARDPLPATAKAPQISRPSRDLLEPTAPEYAPIEVNARPSRKRQEISFRDAVDAAHHVSAATPKAPQRFSPSRDSFAPAVPVEEAAPTRFKRHVVDPQVSDAFD